MNSEIFPYRKETFMYLPVGLLVFSRIGNSAKWIQAPSFTCAVAFEADSWRGDYDHEFQGCSVAPAI